MFYTLNMEKDFIAKRFANLRIAKNISARKLSDDLGQGSQYINQIENGKKMPSIEGLFKFCNYLNISLKEFFDEKELNPTKYKEIINLLDKLNTEELEELTAIIKRIAKNKNKASLR